MKKPNFPWPYYVTHLIWALGIDVILWFWFAIPPYGIGGGVAAFREIVIQWWLQGRKWDRPGFRWPVWGSLALSAGYWLSVWADNLFPSAG